MKKTILAVSILTLFSLALVPFANSAIIPLGEEEGGGVTAPDVTLDLWDILARAINWVFGLVIAVAAIMLIWAGFTYVTSAGNAEKVKTALNGLIYALIGVGIAILAKGLVYLVCTFVNEGGQCNFF